MKLYSGKQTEELASVFDALGHKRRIAIFLALQAAEPDGLTFGALAKRANIADPSLSHHIRMMKKCGLIQSQIKGQFTAFKLDLSVMRDALKHLGLQ